MLILACAFTFYVIAAIWLTVSSVPDRLGAPLSVAPLTEDERYWARIDDLAARFGTDGCTGFANVIPVQCCDEHDLHVEYRINFTDGQPIPNKKWADWRFFKCIVRHTTLGYLNPLAYIYYGAVRLFGKTW